MRPAAPGMRGALLACVLVLACGMPASAQDLLARLRTSAPGIDAKVLKLALEAVDCAASSGAARRPVRLAVIDYTRPSTQRRLWLFDIEKGTLLEHEYVAHGRGSGGNVPTRFSNTEGSYQSSIGLFAAAETYQGHNGYSLRLDGLEPGVNDHARERLLVMHGADYVDPVQGRRQGRLGRSAGQPQLRPEATHEVIDALKDGQLLFAYADDAAWLGGSRFLGCDKAERKPAR
ncbi:MAG: murein L,D-transpeptidase catalytic domain family protein [Luteimonas sp.]|nr:murein L,D-transpeptidase catalytic domain family protein [Luteimonas sp.]